MRITRFRVFSFAPDRQLLSSRAGIRTWAVGDARPPWYPSLYLYWLRPAVVPPLCEVPFLGYSNFDLCGERRVGPAVSSARGRLLVWSLVCGVSYRCHRWGQMTEESPFVLSTCKSPGRTWWAGLGHVPLRERHWGWSPRSRRVPLNSGLWGQTCHLGVHAQSSCKGVKASR